VAQSLVTFFRGFAIYSCQQRHEASYLLIEGAGLTQNNDWKPSEASGAGTMLDYKSVN